MAKKSVMIITGLLDRAGAAHGKYEREALNGVYDQDWHHWYAEWALDHSLNDLLTQPTDAERLSVIFHSLNEQHKQTDRHQSWSEFTAERLATPSLPSLANWEPTAHSLHKAAQVLGVIRMIRLPHVPNYLEMALKIRPEGLSTDVLPAGGEVILDFERASLVVLSKGETAASLTLAGHSQTSLLKALLNALKDKELADTLNGVAEYALVENFLAAATAAGHDLSSPENQITGNEPLEVNHQHSTDYG